MALTTIELAKQQYHFSAAHFTIFSATERERLHGHNFRLAIHVTGKIDNNGLCFDYAIIKKIMKAVCEELDEYTLIAANSPHLVINEKAPYYQIQHHKDTLLLLQTDTILLPVTNVTIEALAEYFLQKLITQYRITQTLPLQKIQLRVCSGPDQWGVANWEA